MALLSPTAKQQFLFNDGAPASGGKLYTYLSGTTTPATTYSNKAGTVANTNPIILDARGEAVIYLTAGTNYRYVLKTDQDAPVWTRDDVTASEGDASAITYTAGTVERLVSARLAERVSVKDFGAKGDGLVVTSAVTIASGANALTVAGASFTTADVGKAIAVWGAGASGGVLYALITAYTSATQVTLSATASTALSGVSKRVVYGTDDAAAFQAAINALPSAGGTIDVPDAVYLIHSSTPSSSTKSLKWNIGAGCVFDGALGGSTSLSAFPRANTNESLYPFGTFVQHRAGAALEGVNTVATTAALFEALQGTHAGNAVGIYGGARSSGAGYLWAANFLAQADAGYSSTLHGIELDVNVFTANAGALIKGLGISGIGTAIASGGRKADVALEIQHGVGWKRGIDILDSDIGVQIRTTCTTGISINNPLTTGAAVVAKQRVNGAAAYVAERFTDTGATGNFMEFKTAAGANLYAFGVDGNASMSGILVSGGFSTTGTTDTYNLLLRFPAPAGGSGQIGLGNATRTTVGAAGGASALPATPLGYLEITVNGVNASIPYYNR